MPKINKICHDCKFCIDKHEDDKGIPNAKCTKFDKTVIEYHMICNDFKKESTRKTA